VKISQKILGGYFFLTHTVDHNILLTRLSSWFGIQGSALDWFKSYLSSRSFWVKCNNNFSSCHSCICGVSQGSVLGPLLFMLYTTPPSTSSLFLNHHLYALLLPLPLQLFFSFYPSVFDFSITQLQHSLQQVSSWMTTNLLTLNSSLSLCTFIHSFIHSWTSWAHKCTFCDFRPWIRGRYRTVNKQHTDK